MHRQSGTYGATSRTARKLRAIGADLLHAVCEPPPPLPTPQDHGDEGNGSYDLTPPVP